jgi:hypothetical protein
MTENDTPTDDYTEITCPVCGSNTWKLFKKTFYPGDGETKNLVGYFRVACSNGCYVDNTNVVHEKDTPFDVIRTAFNLIRADRGEDKDQVVIMKDMTQALETFKFVEDRLLYLENANWISEYGRGELEMLRQFRKKIEGIQ